MEGLIAPVVHTALGADSLLVAANVLSTQATNLGQTIQANVGVNQATEEQILGNLQADINSMKSKMCIRDRGARRWSRGAIRRGRWAQATFSVASRSRAATSGRENSAGRGCPRVSSSRTRVPLSTA